MKGFFKQLIGPIGLIMLVSFWMPRAVAATEARPEVMLQNVTQEMLATLKREDDSIKKNPNKLRNIVEKILVPHVDIMDMSRWVVGRNAWLSASEAQKEAFATQFKLLLIRTYSSTLTAYTDQTIEYLPSRESITSKSRVQVQSLIKEQGRQPTHVSYRLTNQSGDWKVYDIKIEGVSLLEGFKAQFAPEIQQSGIDFVINQMKNHNEKPILQNE